MHHAVANADTNYHKRMFDITDGLIHRGYSNADIELIPGGISAEPGPDLERSKLFVARRPLGIFNSRC
jgi:hypothetical protein